jgi:DNA-binding NarL/FixJ family response regulator
MMALVMVPTGCHCYFRGAGALALCKVSAKGGQAISDQAETRAIFILEDVPATRDWLHALVTQAYPRAIVDHATSLVEARRWLRARQADEAILCLIDLGLPDGSGVDFIRELLVRLPSARAVVTTLYDDDEHLLAALAAGASGYLLKDHEPADIVRRLLAMERGESPISPAMAERILAHFRNHARLLGGQAEPAQLTPRETDVLRLIGRGLKVSEAAGALGLSETTVSGYLKTIYRKLDIGSRAEAAIEAVRRGLV